MATVADELMLKFLVSNGDAGIIIGQRGSNVVAIQEGTGCSIKISQSGTYFPGTMQRVVLVVCVTLAAAGLG